MPNLATDLARVMAAFPAARIHVVSRTKKPKPQVGDVKTVKGVRYVRILRPAYGPNGRVVGHQVRNGRPLFDWVRFDEKETPNG